MKIWKAAIYVRLSKDDEGIAESNSILGQKSLLKTYVSRQEDIRIVMEATDDGYSGMNFKRLGFQQMLKAVDEKKVDCIIVKDFSRFGRNYIESGRYIQQIFPNSKVRFISVNDNYDSEKMDGRDMTILPFKMLLNDYYARDISIKVRSQIIARQKKGEYIGSFPVFGYCRQGKKLIVDKDAAPIIRLIFRMSINGYSKGAISRFLNQTAFPSPGDYKLFCEMKYKTPFGKKFCQQWYPTTVERILENEIYKGNLCQGKTRIDGYSGCRELIMREDWIKYENTHEALISGKDWEIIKRLKVGERTSPKQETIYPLSPLLKCGRCKTRLTRKKVKSAGREYVYYVCNKDGCKNRLREKKLMEILQNILMNKCKTLKADSLSEMYKKHLKNECKDYEIVEKNLIKVYEKIKVMELKLKSMVEQNSEIEKELEEYAHRLLFGINYFREKSRSALKKDCIGENIFQDVTKKFYLPFALCIIIFQKIEVNDHNLIIFYNYREEETRCTKV